MDSYDANYPDGNSLELVGNGAKTSFPANAAAVSPSDSTTFEKPSAVYVGGTGDVVVRTAGGQTLTFSAVPAGAMLPVMVTQVRAATTATNLVRVY